MMLNQPWEYGWCINEKKLMKLMTCNPALDKVGSFVFFASCFLITRFLPSK